ncbi:MAG: hypothetical protein FVQ80_03590 [Planctomycetes bacterium]|nr:hypothetical protein [Planctomycetota bacterium]
MDTVKIMDQQWDYLIVLDACRYDYFEQVWQKYLTGDLTKKLSVGTGTSDWRDKSFFKYYDDIVYVSANPYINSLKSVKGFSANEYFHKVYDLWLNNWDDEKGTVMPDVVTKQAIDIVNNHPEKRAIIHYLQPHEPYLGSSVSQAGFEKPTAGGYLLGVRDEQIKSKIGKMIMKLCSAAFYWTGIRGKFLLWKIRELLKLPPAGPMDAVRRKYGDDILRQAYKENLEIALPHVAKLVENISGKIIITADHGEMLGEDKCYCHWSRAKKKFLREIPWLVIDKGEKVTTPKKVTHEEKDTSSNLNEKETKEQIQQRLKALGYMD